MLINKDLNYAMRAGRIRRGSIRKQNESAGIVAACMALAGFVLMVLFFLNALQ